VQEGRHGENWERAASSRCRRPAVRERDSSSWRGCGAALPVQVFERDAPGDAAAVCRHCQVEQRQVPHTHEFGLLVVGLVWRPGRKPEVILERCNEDADLAEQSDCVGEDFPLPSPGSRATGCEASVAPYNDGEQLQPECCTNRFFKVGPWQTEPGVRRIRPHHSRPAAPGWPAGTCREL
jgi:hypothetical protein